jgi:hypothetical protein
LARAFFREFAFVYWVAVQQQRFSETLRAWAVGNLIGMANDSEQDLADPKTKLAHL